MRDMKRTTALAAALFVSGVFLVSACRPPKSLRYTSGAGDFQAEVPYGWQVFFDGAGSGFANTTFVGPFDADFFRGAPSLSVRWHAYGAPHAMPLTAQEESYFTAEDYIDTTLKEVYGEDAAMEQPLQRIEVSGREAKHFIVAAPLEVGKGARYGVSRDGEGNLAVLRYHEYVVLPMNSGFYAIIYPATKDGYPKHKDEFLRLVNSFKALRDGPGGRELE